MSKNVKFNARLELSATSDMLKKRGLVPGGRVQTYIDSEVIRYCDTLVPVDTHTLRKTAKTYSEIGYGTIKYVTPYAKKQYYTNSGERQTEPERGKLWFERMKERYKEQILQGAIRISGET